MPLLYSVSTHEISLVIKNDGLKCYFYNQYTLQFPDSQVIEDGYHWAIFNINTLSLLSSNYCSRSQNCLIILMGMHLLVSYISVNFSKLDKGVFYFISKIILIH